MPATRNPNVLAAASIDTGLASHLSIRLANKERFVILSNKLLDARLETSLWRSEKKAYPAWSGTFIAYPDFGKSFKESDLRDGYLVYVDTATINAYLFPVPVEYRNEKGIALAANHGFDANANPTIAVENYGMWEDRWVYKIPSVKPIPFPQESGWYLPEPEFGIPTGKRVFPEDAPGARFLQRSFAGYFGLLARIPKRFISACESPSLPFGLIVTTTEDMKEAGLEGEAMAQPELKER